MAEIVTMPRLSDTMTEGTVAKWHKKVGDKVSEGDLLADIETDKATMEFESFQEGTLLHIGTNEGDTAPVDSILAILGESGEDISTFLSGENIKDNNSVTVEQEKVSIKDTVNNISDVSAEDLGVEIVTMPRLSDTMTEGTVAKWHKKVGDKVSEGDLLADIETDKATMEFESFQEGTLLHIGIDEGSTAPVDSILAILGELGTDVTPLLSKGNTVNVEKVNQTIQPANLEIKTEKKVKTPTKKAITLTTHRNPNERLKVSPLAKKMASEKGINLNKVIGTGDSGRIIKRDIDNYEPVANLVNSVTSAVGLTENYTESIISQMRKTVAKRLTESKFTAPHYYLTIEIDMDNTIQSRKAINSLPDTKVSFNDIVIKATSVAIRKHPNINTYWQQNKIRYNNHIHIGVAVAVEDGLLVPVVKFADTKSLTQISKEVKDYAKRASGKEITTKRLGR